MNSGVPQGSILGPLLFLLYVNDLPNVINNSKVYLFADDTTLVAIDRSLKKLSDDFNAVAEWLAANRLTLNMKKTVQINFTRKSASNETILYDGKNLSSEIYWKYLGINIDFKLGFSNHIDFVRKKLRKQCGIIAKTRHYVPSSVMFRYYESNIKSIIQYGILVYGCTSYNALPPLFELQKKIIRLISFRNNCESVSDIFVKHKILTVHELYIYEGLKFQLRSLSNPHSENYLNSLFIFDNSIKRTRRSVKNLLKICKLKSQIENHSLTKRGTKLLNIFQENGIIPINSQSLNASQVLTVAHKLKYLYILGNIELTNFIFDK